ncbi:MAG: 6-hydroxynicotinate reductase, partial [Pseudomonadota bacterium]
MSKIPAGKIRCDACPVTCYIAEGRSGACDRYANHDGELVRLDTPTVLERVVAEGGKLVPVCQSSDWDGDIVHSKERFLTAVGTGTTYPDYKPAPFIVSQEIDGADLVTVVTEGIFSYCGIKVKIDTDQHIGDECATVRAQGEAVGHVTTGEYGSKMLSLGGVDHLTGGSKKEGRITCETLLALANREAVTLTIDEGAEVVVQAGEPPVINGALEARMRVGCGSATIGMFAMQWSPLVDEVVVVDDHITGVLSEHEAGKGLDVRPTGIRIRGRKSTPGRYFQVANPGTGWGGTDIQDPLSIIESFKPDIAWPGLRLLMVSTTGEQWAYFELDEALQPQVAEMGRALRETVERVEENCEPSVCSVLLVVTTMCASSTAALPDRRTQARCTSAQFLDESR